MSQNAGCKNDRRAKELRGGRKFQWSRGLDLDDHDVVADHPVIPVRCVRKGPALAGDQRLLLRHAVHSAAFPIDRDRVDLYDSAVGE